MTEPIEWAELHQDELIRNWNTLRDSGALTIGLNGTILDTTRETVEGKMKYGAIDGLDTPISRLILGGFAVEEMDLVRSKLEVFLAAGGNAIDTGHDTAEARASGQLGNG